MVIRAGHVVHIVGEDTKTRRAGLCGATRGKAWVGSPNHVSWLYDKWCSKCWGIAQQQFASPSLFERSA